MEWYEKQYSPGDYLEHYGVLGMKWGHHKAKVAAKKERKRREKADIEKWNKRLEGSKLQQLTKTGIKDIKINNTVRKKAAKYLAKNKYRTPEEALVNAYSNHRENVAIAQAYAATGSIAAIAAFATAVSQWK